MRSGRALARKTPAQVAVMRTAGAVVAAMHAEVRAAALPGVTTSELDAAAREVLARHGATSNFLGYHGFPAVICASVNDEVLHGIPGPRVLAGGDVLKIDCGAVVDGWHADAAFTMVVGGAPVGEVARLLDVATQALAAGIAAMQPGGRLGDIGAAVEEVVFAAGFGNPREYCGHGIGRAMHEEPDVENRGRRGRGPELSAGVVLAIEPMLIGGGRDDVYELDDGWTVVSADGSLGAHVEHTVAITDDGPQILTLPAS
jgi:methionyl aminopeptidase